MALLLSALLMQNVIPGPEMLRDNLPLTFTLLWGLALANIIGGVSCFFLVGYCNLTRLISIAPRYIVPTIMAIIYVGAFVSHNKIGDLIVVAAGLGMLILVCSVFLGVIALVGEIGRMYF